MWWAYTKRELRFSTWKRLRTTWKKRIDGAIFQERERTYDHTDRGVDSRYIKRMTVYGQRKPARPSRNILVHISRAGFINIILPADLVVFEGNTPTWWVKVFFSPIALTNKLFLQEEIRYWLYLPARNFSCSLDDVSSKQTFLLNLLTHPPHSTL